LGELKNPTTSWKAQLSETDDLPPLSGRGSSDEKVEKRPPAGGVEIPAWTKRRKGGLYFPGKRRNDLGGPCLPNPGKGKEGE